MGIRREGKDERLKLEGKEGESSVGKLKKWKGREGGMENWKRRRIGEMRGGGRRYEMCVWRRIRRDWHGRKRKE